MGDDDDHHSATTVQPTQPSKDGSARDDQAPTAITNLVEVDRTTVCIVPSALLALLIAALKLTKNHEKSRTSSKSIQKEAVAESFADFQIESPAAAAAAAPTPIGIYCQFWKYQ